MQTIDGSDIAKIDALLTVGKATTIQEVLKNYTGGSFAETAAKISKARRSAIKEYTSHRGDRYRITRDGEVHIYGKMPNSIETGWWLAGTVENVLQTIANPSAAMMPASGRKTF